MRAWHKWRERWRSGGHLTQTAEKRCPENIENRAEKAPDGFSLILLGKGGRHKHGACGGYVHQGKRKNLALCAGQAEGRGKPGGGKRAPNVRIRSTFEEGFRGKGGKKAGC